MEINAALDRLSKANDALLNEKDILARDVQKINSELADSKRLGGYIEGKIDLISKKTVFLDSCGKRLPYLHKSIESLRNQQAQVNSEVQKRIDQETMEGFPSLGSWENPVWKNWIPDSSNIRLPAFLRLGEDKHGVPVGIPFMGQQGEQGAVLILASQEKAALAKNIFGCLVLRIALSLPKISRFCLIDPELHGRSFRMQRDLADVRKTDVSLEQDLQLISSDIKRISTDVLGYEDSFEHVSPDIWAAERFESVFVADFGSHKTTTPRFLESLLDIANGGRPAGRYLFIHVNTDSELPRGIDLARFRNAMVLDLNQDAGVTFDILPEGREQSRLLGIVRNQKAPEKKVDFETLVGVNAASGWGETSKEYIETPVGSNLSVWFGQKDGKNCAHAALAGSTGSGKSNFLHVLISGLALRYSPHELQLYLVDGKSGVGFKRYERLPHAKVVSLQTSPLLALSVIRDLLVEMEARYELFSQHGVDSIISYRNVHPEQLMPRLLLVADEYQNLFESDSDEASSIIAKLAEKGRAAGIHLLLSSQRFVAQGMRKSDYIFNNIAMRISLQLSDVGSVVEFFGQKGRKMIKELDRPGLVVINDNLGEDTSNRRGMTAMLSDAESKKINKELMIRAESSDVFRENCVPTVFQGNESPEFMSSKTMKAILSLPGWLKQDELESLAKQSIRNGGLGIANWHSSQQPLAVMSGRLFEVHGDFLFSFQRKGNEHLLLVGDNASHACALMSSSLASVAAIHSSDQVQFHLIDLVPPEMSGGRGLKAIVAGLLEPLGYSAILLDDEIKAAESIRALASIVDERKKYSDLIEQPSLLIIVNGLEDLTTISLAEGCSHSDVKQDLQKIVRYGGQVGVHMIVNLSSIQHFSGVFDEHKDLKRFNHRFAWQISDEDSRMYMGSSDASRLSELSDGNIAMYRNMMMGKAGICFFRPYYLKDEEIVALRKKFSERVE